MNPPDVFNLLPASGPYLDYAEKLMLYGQFVGAWDVDVIRYKKGRVISKGKGKWVFNWILGGRGIQDVLYAANAAPDQYGTTLRCYDSIQDAWHITWMQPSSGEFVNLLGRRIADRIVQEGIGTDLLRRERWSFTQITPNSFVWLGEVSADRGATWVLEEEMRAVRCPES